MAKNAKVTIPQTRSKAGRFKLSPFKQTVRRGRIPLAYRMLQVLHTVVLTAPTVLAGDLIDSLKLALLAFLMHSSVEVVRQVE